MEAKKLLIADSAEDFSLALRDILPGNYHIRIARDGKEALQLLERFRPDILVLDLILPGLDGITLLQTAVSSGLRPMVLATSAFFSDYVIQTLTEFGVGYIMRKPCPPQAVADRIRDLSVPIHPQRSNPSHPENQAAQIMIAMGFKTKWDGYLYLKEAIALAFSRKNPSVTKELYPAIAAVYDTKPDLVERSIRSAIVAAWRHRDERIWQQYFPPGPDGHIPRPTNADFIAQLVEYIRYL